MEMNVNRLEEASLAKVLSTCELSRRTPRPPDHAAENRALVALAQEMTAHPGGLPQKLADFALDLCKGHSAGISVLQPDGQGLHFHWQAVSGAYAPHAGGSTPYDHSPCGVTLARGAPQLFSRPARHFDCFRAVQPAPVEALVVPVYADGEPLAAIWVVAHDDERHFDVEDARLLQSLGDFTGAALRTQSILETEKRAHEAQVEINSALETEIRWRKQAQQLSLEQMRLLEMIASGRSLQDCLAALCAAVPKLSPGARASVLLADDRRLAFERPIAPDLLPSFGEGLEGAPINDLAIGTCGSAVYYGKPVSCLDIASTDYWSAPWRELCIANGIRACHSTPIPDRDGFPLGSFMLCLDEARAPNEWEQRLAEFGSRLASIVLERDRTGEARYRALFEAIPLLCFTVARSGEVLTANQRALQTLGIDAPAIASRDFAQLHPEDAEQVRGRLAETVRHPGTVRHWETRIRTRDGELRWVRETACVVERANEDRMLLVACEDITDERRLPQLAYRAAHDPLTGLLNRHEFERRLEHLIETAHSDDKNHVVSFIDLDQFKIVNDTRGHLAGDAVLRQVAQLLRARLRAGDTVARLGGDEFGLLLAHCDVATAREFADQLLGDVEQLCRANPEDAYPVGMSIGLAVVTATTRDVTQVLQAADAACYQAKARGRHRSYVFHPGDAVLSRRHGEFAWVNRVALALKNDRLRLVYQPLPSTAEASAGAGHEPRRYELLVRMLDKAGRCVPAAEFLPAAERYGLASRLDQWVIKTAFDWLRNHPAHVERLVLCAINLSAQSLNDDQCLGLLHARLADGSVPPGKVCLEITETAAINHMDEARRAIEELQALGCRFALDDFGSGLTSFSALKALPVDILKIDGTLVQALSGSDVNLAIVESLNHIAHLMGKQTVAEGIEDIAVLGKLRDIGVDFVQGYALGAPRAIEELA